MSLQEQKPLYGSPEKIPFLDREAVKFVPVGEFLQLRFQRGRACSDAEEIQLHAGEAIIQTLAKEQGKTYTVDDEIKRSIDPNIIFARRRVSKISLPEYLAVRHKVLNEEIYKSIHLRNEYELLGKEEVEKENKKQDGRLADLNLTNKVIAAAKVNLSSVV